MKKTLSKENLRGLILIGIVALLIVGIYIFSISTRKKAEVAYVKYRNQTLFTINLSNGKFQAESGIYVRESIHKPIIDGKVLYDGQDEITDIHLSKGVLKYDNVYVIMGYLGYVYIEYDEKTHMVRVKEETSPYNICSRQGYSNSAPIVCLPNFVTIEFTKLKDVDVIV